MSAAPTIMDGMLICEPGGSGHVDRRARSPSQAKSSGNPAAINPRTRRLEKSMIAGVPHRSSAYMDSGLVALDLKTGKELWRYDYPGRTPQKYPAAGGRRRRRLLHQQHAGLAQHSTSYNGESGEWSVKRLWSARKEKLHYSSPVRRGLPVLPEQQARTALPGFENRRRQLGDSKCGRPVRLRCCAWARICCWRRSTTGKSCSATSRRRSSANAASCFKAIDVSFVQPGHLRRPLVSARS